ncbi:transcription termination factor Rho [Nocardioides coralli]|uniref:transcription termination factor Rho n=1 Tax=Nocardioides coralli TaxID=2872154 RepID=UPI0020173CDA|nr:transcription termination factor Rho [Nocardioides coralli]
MTETIDTTVGDGQSAQDAAPKKRGGGLNAMRIADLKSLAGSLGISGAGSMKKAELVSAIKAAQSGGQSGGAPAKERDSRDDQRPTDSGKPADEPRSQDQPAHDKGERRDDRRDDRADDRRDDQGKQSRGDREADGSRDGGNDGAKDGGKDTGRDGGKDGGKDKSRNRQDRDRQDRDRNRDQAQGNPGNQNQQNQNRNQGGGRPDDGDGRSSRSRRRRGRDRNRGGGSGGSQRSEPDTTILEDDVLLPAAGILDVLDNYAFVRTSGYLPGSEDVYLSLSMVRKFGLRRGDAIVGQVRQPREGERKEKFNPMVRVDSVNGADPEAARDRVEFSKLTPLYPSDRLRLETEPTNLIGRVIDIAAPIGKGQRGLIVSPAKAGKTMIMQSIANSITTNNPECHLMVVLVDERPEEVTDFERSVKGEVISSTFDRPASDHTTVAELAIERAKRLVELGHDVVVLLDGITRLGRAYNLAAPASGRILSGGVDSAALYPPKRFFGAARNIENGGSLTILATALIESGSKMDEVIFEEFKGTGNMEIRLRRDFADKRLFPAIDAVQSGTRREELLMSKDELAIVWKLRRVLSGLDGQQALELLLERLKKSQSNIEFLMQVQKTTPGAGQND